MYGKERIYRKHGCVHQDGFPFSRPDVHRCGRHAADHEGTRPFSAKSAELWARVFDYSPTRLLFGTGPLYADGTDVVDDKSVALFLHRNTMERLNEARTEYEQSSRRSLHWDDVMQNLMDSAGIP